MSSAVAKGATGAGLFSSSSPKQESRRGACQPGLAGPEQSACSNIPEPGAQLSRRSVMNMLVSAAVVGTAIPQAVVSAAGPDPILAAIETHRQVYEQLAKEVD